MSRTLQQQPAGSTPTTVLLAMPPLQPIPLPGAFGLLPFMALWQPPSPPPVVPAPKDELQGFGNLMQKVGWQDRLHPAGRLVLPHCQQMLATHSLPRPLNLPTKGMETPSPALLALVGTLYCIFQAATAGSASWAEYGVSSV